MKILIIDNGSAYLNSLIDLVSKDTLTIKSYEGIIADDSANFDLIILSGGHQYSVVGHEDIFRTELELIKHTTTPILGICLGFELIAQTFGSTLTQLVSKEKNIVKLTRLIQDPIFARVDTIEVFESHRWVVDSVGDELLALANSKDGIEIIKHKTKLIYGFQFHPEMFVESTQGDEIFANFINIVQNKTV